MATAIFIEAGTDSTQDLSLFTATSVTGTGAVTSSTAQQFTGPRSLACTNGATQASAALAYKAGVLDDAGRRISWRFRQTAIPILGTPNAVSFFDNAGLSVTGVGLNTSGKLICATVAGTTVLNLNQWYRISVGYTITNTTTFTLKVYLNGVLEITAINSQTLPRTGTNRIVFNLTSGGNQYPANSINYYDDIYVDDGSDFTDPGDIQITNKRPNANGTTNDFSTQIGVSGSGYGSGHSPQVNEQPLSQTNGWSMVGAGSAITEEYNVENGPTGDVNLSGALIKSVMGWVYAKSLAGETAQIVVDGTASNITLTTSAALFSAFSTTPTVYPAGSGTDIGIITATDLTTVSLYEAGILIAFALGTADDFDHSVFYAEVEENISY